MLLRQPSTPSPTYTLSQQASRLAFVRSRVAPAPQADRERFEILASIFLTQPLQVIRTGHSRLLRNMSVKPSLWSCLELQRRSSCMRLVRMALKLCSIGQDESHESVEYCPCTLLKLLLIIDTGDASCMECLKACDGDDEVALQHASAQFRFCNSWFFLQ